MHAYSRISVDAAISANFCRAVQPQYCSLTRFDRLRTFRREMLSPLSMKIPYRLNKSVLTIAHACGHSPTPTPALTAGAARACCSLSQLKPNYWKF